MSLFFEVWAWAAGIITAIVGFFFACAFISDADDDDRLVPLLALAYIIAFVSAFLAGVVAIGEAG